MSLLKEVYNESFLNILAETVLTIDQKFNKKNFLELLNKWDEKELKQRMRAITFALKSSLSTENYREKIAVLKQVAKSIPKNKTSSLALIIFPDFVENFGLDDFDFSMKSLEFFTEFGSSEFAVRKFIKLNKDHALKFFRIWAESKNYHIRRLASEGLRPMLPWGEALQDFKKNPVEIVPIIEKLKHDEEVYVRKSVANNLNDISKNHPQLVIDILRRWRDEKVDPSLIKQALRTLLKNGNKQALALLDIKHGTNYNIQNFALQKNAVKIPESLVFDFTLENRGQNNKIRLEYAIYFLRKNKLHFKKIFQISTKNFDQGIFYFKKNHSFRNITTRKYNAGLHMISLIINGIENEKLKFELI